MGLGNGYCFDSWKSNNALMAEDEGKYPKTQAIKVIKDALGKNATLAQVKALIEACRPCEWHHTSSAFNRTYYYDTVDILERLGTGDLILPQVKTSKKSTYQSILLHVEFEEWESGWKRGRRHYYKEERSFPCYIRFKPGARMVDLILPDGSLWGKKKIDSLSIYFVDNGKKGSFSCITEVEELLEYSSVYTEDSKGALSCS